MSTKEAGETNHVQLDMYINGRFRGVGKFPWIGATSICTRLIEETYILYEEREKRSNLGGSSKDVEDFWES